MEEDTILGCSSDLADDFNPLPRMEEDKVFYGYVFKISISIHFLAWRKTAAADH